jgi:hypothetical protein
LPLDKDLSQKSGNRKGTPCTGPRRAPGVLMCTWSYLQGPMMSPEWPTNRELSRCGSNRTSEWSRFYFLQRLRQDSKIEREMLN